MANILKQCLQHSPSFLSLLLLLYLPSYSNSQNTTASTDPSYYYNLCAPSTCGRQNLAYPFAVPTLCNSPAFTTSCPGDGHVHLSSARQTGTHRAFGNLTSDAVGLTFLIAADALFTCGRISHPDFNSDPSIFSLPIDYTYGTHLNCTKPPASLAGLQPAQCLRCANGTDQSNVCYYSPGFVVYPNCENFLLYLPVTFNISAEKDLRGYLQKGYPIRYNKAAVCAGCEASGGRCGHNPVADFVCFCSTAVHTNNCSDGLLEDLRAWFPNQQESGSSSKSDVLVIALSTSASLLGLLVLAALLAIFAFRRKRKNLQDTESFEDSRANARQGLRDAVDSIAPMRYSYSQIKKFTNNFSLKLGEGGFGKIYKGVIQKKKHELVVAIKVLKLSKQSEKQFMNEVATIGRIHHNNLVKMLGYCVERKKRALVYEYMENGSLDKYIKMIRIREHGSQVVGDGSNLEYCLGPKQMHTIALETAMGILYLHQGCRSRILHCDIKPHNVLLDSNLSAKVSDFGLARMIDKDRSHISLTVAQGTPGYAAPEVWSRSYGPITEKSDVYSYGILLLEMAGGRIKNESDAEAKSDAIASNSQVHLPLGVVQYVKDKFVTSGGLSNSDQIKDSQMNEEDDEEIIARMCLVGLWCIQHIPSHRPSMNRVILMLKGSAKIEIPPDPFPHDEANEQPNNYLTSSTVYLSAMAETL